MHASARFVPTILQLPSVSVVPSCDTEPILKTTCTSLNGFPEEASVVAIVTEASAVQVTRKKVATAMGQNGGRKCVSRQFVSWVITGRIFVGSTTKSRTRNSH